MFDKVKPKGSNLYRGEIPFFLAGNKKNVVYLCSSKRNMNDYYWMLKDFYNGTVIKPEESNDSDYINFNYEIIEAINKNQNFIVLVTLEIFLKEYQYSGNRIQLEVGKKFDLKELVKKFDSNEYKRNYLIENRMEYSLRGDILDFFPINGEHPVRVEFFDDLIDRISFFDIESQRSIEKKESIELYMDNNKHDISNFLELFNGKIKESEMNYFIENREVLKYKLDEIIFAAPANKEENLRARFEVGAKDFSEISIKYFSNEEILVYRDFAEIKKLSEKKKIIICSDEELRYREIFQHATNINFEKYPLYEGFENNNILYLSDRELKGIRVKRDKKGKTEIKHHDISQIKEGDYIIHENFGVGIYQGLEIINHEEYLIIKYADEDRLFVSTNNLSKIERFIVEPSKVPDVFRLGRKGFRNKREKIKEDLMIFAREIVAVQAKRNSHTGFMFGKDGLMQEEFEDGFPFTLTRDQAKAIEDVKRDMESGKVMDRIICGDVGCGKTEVAIRAAFKCVADGKQVAIMVPTTVLAQQHFERFEERFKNYPFNVELMSRLKTSREISECIKRIAQGSTDIIIGTHKILSDEIKFKDLGLVIIDEEQKFGVKSKEKLKQLQNNVDMLTLTATPIPRTLNLALLGIRDISTIETLPENRLPIQDYFIENHPSLVREAIMKEFAREGQVFYIYNSVKKMPVKEKEIREILPEFIKTSHIHGQMQPKDIRNTLIDFERGDIDVLLATTIIENGIDIENANTIIIDGMEKLGLAQLYQLRGRIGRGSEKGYCYILVDEENSGDEIIVESKNKKKKSKLREETMRGISEFGEGTGFYLSMEDMRIRGAGEILGERQHGALEVFGYGLYLKLLQDEIAKIKGEYIEEIEGFNLELLEPRFIPDSYIEKKEKIIIYKRVSKIKNLDSLKEIKTELIDRFGKMPKVAENYFDGEEIKIKAMIARIISVTEKSDGSYFKFQNNEVNVDKILKLIEKNHGIYLKLEKTFCYKGKPIEFLNYYLGGDDDVRVQ